MKFSLTKLKEAFGKPEPINTVQDDNFTDNLIKSIEQKPFAISNENVCFATANELAGYYYLQTIIVGKFKIKTFDGAQLTVRGTDFEMTLESDMLELESELYAIPKSYTTRIDFMLNEKDLSKINRSQIQTLVLSAKKQKVEFSIIQEVEEKIEEEIAPKKEETN